MFNKNKLQTKQMLRRQCYGDVSLDINMQQKVYLYFVQYMDNTTVLIQFQ